jgi:hypothetical protein
MTSSSPSVFSMCVASLFSPLSLRESKIRTQTAEIFNAILHVKASVERSKSLLSSLKRVESIQPHKLFDIEHSIIDTDAALQEVQLLVELLRIDEMEKGEFRWGSKAKWVASDKRELAEKLSRLGICHQSLTKVIVKMENLFLVSGNNPLSNLSPVELQVFEHRLLIPTTPGSVYTPSSLMNWKRKSKTSHLEYRALPSSSGPTFANSAPVELCSSGMPPTPDMRLFSPAVNRFPSLSSHNIPCPELGYASPAQEKVTLQSATRIHPRQQCSTESLNIEGQNLEETRYQQGHFPWSSHTRPPKSFHSSVDIDAMARGKEV